MLYLGMIYKKDIYGNDILVNHRSLLKIILNPLLRYFGYFINTIYCKYTDKISGIEILKIQDGNSYRDIIQNYKDSIFYPFDKGCMTLKKSRMFI